MCLSVRVCAGVGTQPAGCHLEEATKCMFIRLPPLHCSVCSETNDALTAENSDMQKLKPHVQPAQQATTRDGDAHRLTHTHTHTLFVLAYTTEHIHVVCECVNISLARLSECTGRLHNSQSHCAQMRYGLPCCHPIPSPPQ